MSEIKWIKLSTDMFEDEKIDHLLSLPNGEAIFLIWFELYLRAKRKSKRNRLYITKEIGYTNELLAHSLNRPLGLIEEALEILTKLEMYETKRHEIIIHLPWLTNQQIRASSEYNDWRKAVYERDQYTCQDCGSKNQLEAHHIKQFAYHKELRFDVSNGITLCSSCHKNKHFVKGE